MADEGLEVVWHCLLCLIIPNLEQVVLTSSQHEAAIMCQIGACDGALVNSVELSEVCSIESSQTVDSDTLVLCHHDQLTIVLRELETTDDMTNLNLMFQND